MEMNRIQTGSVDAHPKTSEVHLNLIYDKLWFDNASFSLWRADRKHAASSTTASIWQKNDGDSSGP